MNINTSCFIKYFENIFIILKYKAQNKHRQIKTDKNIKMLDFLRFEYNNKDVLKS